MAGEFGVGHDVNPVNAADGREVVEDVFNHRLAGDGQQRLRLVQGKRVQPRGVAGGQDDNFHVLESVPYGAEHYLPRVLESSNRYVTSGGKSNCTRSNEIQRAGCCLK